MYRTDHKEKYRTLPISVFDTTADGGNPKYGHWPLHGEDQELRRYFIRHQHETVELLYNMEGVLHIELEDQKFRLGEGDFVIVNPFVNHAGDFRLSEMPNCYRCVQIELGFFIPAVQNRLRDAIVHLLDGTGHFCEYVPASHPAAASVAAIIGTLQDRLRASNDSAENDCHLMAEVYELLAHLIKHFYIDTPDERRDSRDLHFIRSVVDYLEDHYAEELSTSVISSALSYNLSHFCHLFRANFHNSFSHYLSEYRIVKSLYYHRDSSIRIGEIASAVGFRDYGYFAQEFKKYTGITPAAFFLGRGK